MLRVGYTGGFVSPPATAGRLPLISVYADGRVISEGPVAAIYPGPALASGRANGTTPWITADGARWIASTFRPLLPDESSCADLKD